MGRETWKCLLSFTAWVCTSKAHQFLRPGLSLHLAQKSHWDSDSYESQHHINLRYHFEQWQGSPCCYLPVQEHKGIVVEQPSILSSLRTPMATATIEPIPPDRLGGLGTFSPVSPTEERSPDAVSSASEATEIGQSSQITNQKPSMAFKTKPQSCTLMSMTWLTELELLKCA